LIIRGKILQKTGKEYDLILDIFGYRSVFANRRALAPKREFISLQEGSLAVLAQILLLGPVIKRASGRNIRVLIVQTESGRLSTITEYVNPANPPGH